MELGIIAACAVAGVAVGMMGELRAFKPGMERKAETKEIDTFVMSSLAEFIATRGKRPIGAIVLWIDDDGEQIVSWCQAEARDLTYAAAHLMKEATGE